MDEEYFDKIYEMEVAQLTLFREAVEKHGQEIYGEKTGLLHVSYVPAECNNLIARGVIASDDGVFYYEC